MAVISQYRIGEHIERGNAQLSAYNAKLVFKNYQEK